MIILSSKFLLFLSMTMMENNNEVLVEKHILNQNIQTEQKGVDKVFLYYFLHVFCAEQKCTTRNEKF